MAFAGFFGKFCVCRLFSHVITSFSVPSLLSQQGFYLELPLLASESVSSIHKHAHLPCELILVFCQIRPRLSGSRKIVSRHLESSGWSKADHGWLASPGYFRETYIRRFHFSYRSSIRRGNEPDPGQKTRFQSSGGVWCYKAGHPASVQWIL